MKKQSKRRLAWILFGGVLLALTCVVAFQQSSDLVVVRDAKTTTTMGIVEFAQEDFEVLDTRTPTAFDIRNLAALAANVYEPERVDSSCSAGQPGRIPVDGWQKLTGCPAPKSCKQELSDLKYEIWSAHHMEIQRHYIAIVFQGTLPTLAHWCSNMRHLDLPMCDPKADQYLHVAPLTDKVLKQVKGCLGSGLDFYPIAVGHSLGGGLAELAGKSSHIKQVFTFDSSPITGSEISSALLNADNWNVYKKIDSCYEQFTYCEADRGDLATPAVVHQVYEQGEFLAPLRFLKRWLLGSQVRPDVIEYRTNLLRGDPVAQHSMKALACELRKRTGFAEIRRRVNPRSVQPPSTLDSQPADQNSESTRRSRLTVQTGHHEEVTTIAFSPDGKLVVTGSGDTSAVLWDVASGRELRRFTGHLEHLTSVAFSPDSRTVLTGSWDDSARLWQVESGEIVKRFDGPGDHGDGINTVAFSPMGDRIATGHRDGASRLWSVTSGDMVHTLREPIEPPNDYEEGFEADHEITSLAFSPDGQKLFTNGYDQPIIVWDLDSGVEVERMDCQDWEGIPVSLSSEGRTLLATPTLGTTSSLDPSSPATESELERIYHQLCGPLPFELLADDTQLLSENRGVLRLRNLATGEELRRFGMEEAVSSWAISPDTSLLALGRKNGAVELRHLPSGDLRGNLSGALSPVTSVALSPDRSWLLTGTASGHADLWNLGSGDRTRRFSKISPGPRALAFHPRSDRILIADSQGAVRLHEIPTGEVVRVFTGHTAAVYTVTPSSDGSQLLTGGEDETARLWNLATGAHLRTFEPCSGVTYFCDSDAVRSGVLSPGGSTVLTASRFGPARLWSRRTGQESLRFQWVHGAYEEGVHAAEFSPDGKAILTGSEESVPRIWNAVTGEEILALEGHEGWVSTLAWLPDGDAVVTAGQDGTVRLWNAQSGQEVRRLMGHGNAVTSMAVTPDGKILVTGSSDGTARLWDIARGRELGRILPDLGCGWVVLDAAGRFDASDNGGCPIPYNVQDVETGPVSSLSRVPGLLGTLLSPGIDPQDGQGLE